MTPWSVVLRGIRYRAGRSAIVLVLVALAVGATVLAPAYARAAQQAVLAERLAAARPNAVALHLSTESGTLAEAKGRLEPLPEYGDPIGGADAPAVVADNVNARVTYRDAICEHLTITAGSCASGTDVMISERSARAHGFAVGQTVKVQGGQTGASPETQRRVAGLYAPRDAAEPYWGRGGYFADGATSPEDTRPRIDAVFVTDQTAVPGRPTVTLDYPLRTDAVTVDTVARLREGVERFQMTASGFDLTLDSAVGAVLDDIDAEAAALGRTVPLVAVPLVLVAWFVVFLVVAGVAEERAPEVGLAKLRGYSRRQVGDFGRAESTVLAVAAVPLGVLGGLAAAVAGGAPAEPYRWPVIAAAAAALVVAVLIVRIASGGPARRPTLTLLRRVPARGLRAAGLAEGVAVAAAAASIVAATADPAGPLALLAPAMLALVAGIVVARLLQLWSRVRVARHANRGAVTGMLAHAQLSRRPAARRAMLVVTIAVALVSFAGAAWDVAAQARTDAAVDTVGASRVLRVAAADPAALASAVRVAAGDQAMPVVRVTERYDAGTVELLAVDAGRLGSVARWRGHSSSEVDTLAGSLAAGGDVPVIVAGRTPADDEAASGFSFPGLGEGSQRYHVVGHVAALPRAAGRALLVDLSTAVAAAQRASGLSDNSRLRYEVWAGDAAPADLGARLANAGVGVIDEESVAAEEAHLAAGAPALGLRLALLAGAAAVALAVGAVLLTAYLGARTRRYEFAALRAAGVRARTLRRAVAREYVHLLVVPGLAGLAVGLAGATLLLPGIPLVTAGVTGAVVMPGRPLALGGAVLLTVLGLGLAVVAVLRLVGGATPERLREGSA